MLAKVETADRPVSESALVDVRWVAAELRCSERHVHRLRDGGLMPAPVKLGALVRWNRNELVKWIADGCPAVSRTNC
jgi:predicted DNA-binding transcriptional regulator AlpA